MNIIYGFSDRTFGSSREDSNLIRFIESLGAAKPIEFVRAKQVHGDSVVRVGREDAGRVIPEADGLATSEKGLFLVISAADCLPILFSDPKRELIAAVHAGWRGTAKGIAVKAVDELFRLGSKVKNVEVIFGPCICWKHYEVGDEVVSQFKQDGYSREVEFVKKEGKVFLDIQGTNRNQLVGAGIAAENIKVNPRCTFEDQNLYSWRREKPDLSGEGAAVIAMK